MGSICRMASRYEVEVLACYRCEQLRQDAEQAPSLWPWKQGSGKGNSKLQAILLSLWAWLQAVVSW